MTDQPATLVRHYARLVALLVRAPEAVVEQKAALRAALVAADAGPVEVVRDGSALVVNGAVLSPRSPDVEVLVARLAAHDVERLEVAQSPPPAEMLVVARALATDPARIAAPGLAAVTSVMSVRVVAAARGVEQPAAGAENDGAQDDGAEDAGAVARALDDAAARAAAAAAGGGDGAAVATVLVRAIERLPAGELPPEVAAARERLLEPALLRVVAQWMVRQRTERDACRLVLARAPHAPAVVADLLAASRDTAERRAYRDALVPMPGGPARLAQLLDHDDAALAECAAEGVAAAAEPGSDASVVPALVRALAHRHAPVRRAAATALGAIGGPGVTTALGEALDEERNADTQAALLAALGRVGTAEAVHRLVETAAPAGGLFGRKSSALRCAAVAALGAARTPEALAALRELTNDRDREVREAVFAAALASGAERRARPRPGAGD